MEGGRGRSIVAQYLSNDITVCSSFILANETIFFYYYYYYMNKSYCFL